jgi:3-phenylpropionate/trans-cinnamate dioxygenase ferredoxin component
MWIRILTSEAEARVVLPENKPRLVVVGAMRLALVRTADGFYAVQDFCTHNKESLSKGSINYQQEIICPWHGYCFDLKTGRESQQRSADVQTYPVKVNEDGLFIDLPE